MRALPMAFLLGGCVTIQPTAEVLGPYRYRCDGIAEPIEATFHNGQRPFVAMSNAQGTLRLPQTRSGSGARYADGQYVFWVKGRDATFEGPDIAFQNCKGL